MSFGMVINHNLGSMNALAALSQNQNSLQTVLQQLSTGKKINSAADDAAGFAISQKMQAQISGLDQASQNAQDGISLIQTAQGALNETQSILQRMRQLSVQSANDTVTNSDRKNIQQEVNQLADELNSIGNDTQFNTKTLLNGSLSNNVATSATLVGGAVASSVNIISASTNGVATGSAITGAVDIHGDTFGSAIGNVTSGGTARTFDNAGLGSSNLTINANNNELTLTIDGVQKTAAIDTTAQGGTSLTFDGATAGETSNDLVNALQTAINNAFSGTGKSAAVSLTNGQLTLTDTSAGGAGANSQITLDGGNALGTLFNGDGAGGTNAVTYDNGTVANDSLTFNLDGSAQSLTLAHGTYNTASDLATALNSAATTAGINANVVFSAQNGAVVATSQTTGSTSSVGSFAGTAAAYLGLTNAQGTGQDENNKLSLSVDGNAVTATIGTGTYTDPNVFAAAVQSAINTALNGTGSAVNVTNSNGHLTIKDATTGTTSSLVITDGTSASAIQKAAASAVGFTSATATNTSATGTNGSDLALQFQIGANQGQGMSVSIGDMRSEALGITSTDSSKSGLTGVDGNTMNVNYSSGNTVTNNGNTEYVLDVSSQTAASNSISVIDNALSEVSTEQANLGAYQNRLEHTVNNLATSSQNLTSAESGITDTDMASAMANFTKDNVLQQAAVSMLAQANQQPQLVLKLLG